MVYPGRLVIPSQNAQGTLRIADVHATVSYGPVQSGCVRDASIGLQMDTEQVLACGLHIPMPELDIGSVLIGMADPPGLEVFQGLDAQIMVLNPWRL